MKNDGDPQDLFSAMTKTRFGDSTKPDSRWWDCSPSGLDIAEISTPGMEMSFRLFGKGTRFSKTSSPNKAIPDNNQLGIKNTITFEDFIIASSIKVGVDIDHPWQGDLSLVLTPPSGTAAILQDKKGAGTHNLKKVFDISSAPELQNLLSQTLKGDWTLGVRDYCLS